MKNKVLQFGEGNFLRCVYDYHRMFGRLPENMMAGYEAIARHYDNLAR